MNRKPNNLETAPSIKDNGKVFDRDSRNLMYSAIEERNIQAYITFYERVSDFVLLESVNFVKFCEI